VGQEKTDNKSRVSVSCRRSAGPACANRKCFVNRIPSCGTSH